MSSQKTRLIIGVVAVAVLLGGFALSRTYTEKKETQQQIQENEKRLFEENDSKIKKYVVSKGENKVVFNKQENTNWAIEGLENADLMQISIDQAIAYMKELEYVQKIENGMDKASDYGLDNGITDEAYDENGKLVSSHKENVALQQGKNKLDVSGIDFTNSDSISVMVWDSMISMCPLADKATINK